MGAALREEIDRSNAHLLETLKELREEQRTFLQRLEEACKHKRNYQATSKPSGDAKSDAVHGNNNGLEGLRCGYKHTRCFSSPDGDIVQEIVDGQAAPKSSEEFDIASHASDGALSATSWDEWSRHEETVPKTDGKHKPHFVGPRGRGLQAHPSDASTATSFGEVPDASNSLLRGSKVQHSPEWVRLVQDGEMKMRNQASGAGF